MSVTSSTTSPSRSIIPKDIFGRAVLGIIAMVVLKWGAIALEIGVKDAPNAFLQAFAVPLIVTFLIRNRFPRTSGIIGFLFALWFGVFESMFLNGDFTGWKWYEYMVTFIGVPVALLTVGLSVRRIIKRK